MTYYYLAFSSCLYLLMASHLFSCVIRSFLRNMQLHTFQMKVWLSHIKGRKRRARSGNPDSTWQKIEVSTCLSGIGSTSSMTTVCRKGISASLYRKRVGWGDPSLPSIYFVEKQVIREVELVVFKRLAQARVKQIQSTLQNIARLKQFDTF